MRLAVDGYVPTAIDVYPLLGRRVVLGSDVRPSPSVLLRVPVGVEEQLGRDTRLVVRRLGSPGSTSSDVVAEATTEKRPGAFLLGRRREIPAALRGPWEDELEADGASRRDPGTATIRARMLRAWRNPAPLATGVSLEPGMVLDAQLLAPGGMVARAIVNVGTEPFVDAPLRPPEE
jgi:hypothetical protein